jgi:hypothetical protein
VPNGTFRGGFDGATLGPWDQLCPSGRLTFGSASPAPMDGTHWARFEVRPGDVEPVTGSNRCEVASGYRFVEGDDAYVRFGVRLGQDWPFEPGKWATVWQERQSAATGNPPLALNVVSTAAGAGHFELSDNADGTRFWTGPALQTDRWYQIVLHIKHSRTDSAGFVEAWVDGARQTMTGGSLRTYHRTMTDAFSSPQLGYDRQSTYSTPGVLYGDGYVVGATAASVGLP